MRIAQVAPLFESVPPAGYGGTERVVAYLTKELVRQGHDVTLFATADSVTLAQLVPVVEHPLRGAGLVSIGLASHMLELGMLAERAASFDIIHFHTDYLHFPLAACLPTPHVTTLHGRLDLPELVPLYRQFRNLPLVSVSDSQRRPLAWANWCATVHHGVPAQLYRFNRELGTHFLFIGRISPEKRVDRAIEIALRTGTPLVIAAKIDTVDREYFTTCIEPLLMHRLVHFVGEVGERKKCALLGGARALLFPIDWPEPFGLVMIEALACGTPVIAYPCGAVPEVVQDGVNGFLVSDQDMAVQAARDIGSIDRQRCREVYEQRFTAARMAQSYMRLYARLVASRGNQPCTLAPEARKER